MICTSCPQPPSNLDPTFLSLTPTVELADAFEKIDADPPLPELPTIVLSAGPGNLRRSTRNVKRQIVGR
jgi:hypothetical protein